MRADRLAFVGPLSLLEEVRIVRRGLRGLAPAAIERSGIPIGGSRHRS
jgi:hypothetical protein